MSKKTPTKNVSKEEFRNFWEKANNFFKGMSESYMNGNWDVTASNGVHATILAADAVLIFSRGYRSSSERHSDVVPLVSNLPLDNSREAAQHLSRILSVKSVVEYTGVQYTAEDAGTVVKHVERFFNWVRRVLPK